MLDHLRKEAIDEIKFGFLKKKYPTRHAYLTTLRDDFPIPRTVILRDCLDGINPLFYTDKRSQKIEDLKANTNASVLFYNPKKLVQIRMQGQLKVLSDQELVKKHRQKALSISKKDYTSVVQPGEAIDNPDHIEYQSEDYFTAIYLDVVQLEYLKLKRPNHIRCLFSKTKENWESTFLAP